MNNFYITKILLTFMLFSSFIFSQEKKTTSPNVKIEESEFSKLPTKTVKFESFWAKEMKRNPEELIIGIGRGITKELLHNGKKGGKKTRYYIKRFLPSDSQLGADVISLGRFAKINHLVNLKRMLSGYLMENFSYKKKRAKSVAYFILIYNALKRADTNYISSKFVPEVNDYIPSKYIGIDKNYKKWPGKTFLIIPLSDNNFSAGEVGQNTEKIILKGNTDINIRKDFVELRKETLEKNKKKLVKKSAKILEEEQKLQKEKQNIEKEKQKIKTDKEKETLAQKEKELNKKISENQQKKENINQEKKLIDEENLSIKKEEKEINKKEKQLNPTVKNKSQAKAETKAKEERSQENISLGQIFFLKTVGTIGAHLKQQIVLINPEDETTSYLDLPGVSGRHMEFVDGDPIFIMYDDPKKLSLYLARLDRTTFKITHKGKENIYGASQIWLHNNAIYVVSLENKKSYLLKYDQKINLLAKSKIEIFPDTSITFAEGKLYCTVMSGSKNASIFILKEDDLSLKGEIK